MSARHARMTERQFTDTIIELAQWFNWHVTHFRPARTGQKWVTPVQGDPGFVDLVLAREGVVLHVELKTEVGRLSRGQQEWAEAIGPTYRLWRPSDMEDIKAELRREKSSDSSST